MKSPFDLERQNLKIESKIVVALERISEAFRVLLWNECKVNSLSPLQIQIIIFVLFHSEEQCTVSYLAQEFNMTKATISDSVKVLLKKGLIKKANNENDSRSYVISLTVEGKKVAGKVSSFANAVEKPIGQLTTEQKEVMLNGLLKLIYNLHRTGVITVQRMCFTCIHYRLNGGEHYCKLLNSKLVANELRADCPEHEEIP